MRQYSTAQVAQMLGLHQPNLQRLIREKGIPFPPLKRVAKLRIRLWTPKDVKRAREAIRKKR
jgi:excisionase family DNA binding protein